MNVPTSTQRSWWTTPGLDPLYVLVGFPVRLRLAAALHRIAEGERNLARLAVELGFAHHSQFAARFRSVFGCTPGRAAAL